jgi:CBS domain-containing protein
MVNVRSIFRPAVVSVEGDERLVDAAERMQNEQVGSVVVMVGGRFAGILTERDLTRAIAEGADPKVDTAGDYMTAEDLAAIERAVPAGAAGDRYHAAQIATLDSERGGVATR